MNGNGNIKKTPSASELNRPNSEGFKILQYEGEAVVRAVDSDGNVLTFFAGSISSSDHGYIEFASTTGNVLADNMDYFIATGTTMGATVNSSTPKPLPDCKVTKALIETYNGSTFGTNEPITITLVDSTGVVIEEIANDILFNARNYFDEKILDIDILKGGFFIRVNVPVMATNPASAKITVILEIQKI